MIIHIILLCIGLGLLVKGADWLVEGGSALAYKHKVSDLVIGLTIIAFGTSMPELVVNTFAAFQGNAEIVYGNIIGSNNFNLYVILGIAGLITPLVVGSGTVRREIPFSFLAVIMLFILSNSFFSVNKILSRIDGVILFVLFCLFLYYISRTLKSDVTRQELKHKEMSSYKIWLFIIAGLIFLVAGGRLVVVQAVNIANFLGISQAVIALTIVAAGTSLPELATSVVAAIKKNNDIAIGNVIGSNIFNIFCIAGISALIKPVSFNVKFNNDMYLLGSGTILLFLAMFLGQKRKLDRWEAGLLLIVYVAYTVLLINNTL